MNSVAIKYRQKFLNTFHLASIDATKALEDTSVTLASWFMNEFHNIEACILTLVQHCKQLSIPTGTGLERNFDTSSFNLKYTEANLNQVVHI